MLEVVRKVREANPSAVYMCDPVMGHPEKGLHRRRRAERTRSRTTHEVVVAEGGAPSRPLRGQAILRLLVDANAFARHGASATCRRP